MFHKMMMMVALMFLAVGCAKEDGTEESALGNTSLAVVWDDGSNVSSVHWAISGNGVDRQGDIDVSDPSAAISTYISGLKVGTGYLMTLTAKLLDQAGAEIGTCEQTANFDVQAGITTYINMTLNCTLTETEGDGVVNAEANICPTADYITVTPLVQALDKVITLGTEVSDKDGDTVSILWSASAGTVTNADQAAASYTCTLAGPVDITLTLKDNIATTADKQPCVVTRTIPVTCKPKGVCGNGTLEPGEMCDDGNAVSEDGCSSRCRMETCGDNTVQAGLGEECDPPNVGNCNSVCKLMGCGNGILEAGEQCDDGAKVPCDGCSATCAVEACGNGIVECTEECDDGNLVSDDACEPTCTLPIDECMDPTQGCAGTKCLDYNGTNVFDACYGAGATNPALCQAVMDCAHNTGCVLTAANGAAWETFYYDNDDDPTTPDVASAAHPNRCYCGSALSIESCVGGLADGECKAQIEAASGSTNPNTVSSRFSNPAYAIGDASGLLLCELQFCADECL